MSYGLRIWGNMAQKADLDKIFKQQKNCVRAMKEVSKFTHTDPLFKDLKILKLQDMVYVELAKTGYNITNKLLPKPIIQLFTHNCGEKLHRI